MDRPLDDMIIERQRANRGRRGGRRDDGPRDGIRKPRYRDTPGDQGSTWLHDRFEDAPLARNSRAESYDRPASMRESEPRFGAGARIRVDNLHYEIKEEDLEDLFGRIGPLAATPRIIYDRTNRSRGIAYITYEDTRDAREAVREYDGQYAMEQRIRVELSAQRRPASGAPGSRSLFDRVTMGERRARSVSPADDGRRRPLGDRYVPPAARTPPPMGSSGRSRLPTGRRPGERRGGPAGGGGGGRGRGRGAPRRDGEGRPAAGGRARKTVEELDAEMSDYFAPGTAGAEDGPAAGGAPAAGNADGLAAPAGDDVDMIE